MRAPAPNTPRPARSQPPRRHALLAQHPRPLLDDELLILVNAWWEPNAFSLPDVGQPADWQIELDTYDPQRTTLVTGGDPVTVGPRSLTVLRAPW